MDIEHWIADAAMILLYWQQNRILALQGPPLQPSSWRERLGKLRRYWPMVIMTVLVAATFAQPYLAPSSDQLAGTEPTKLQIQYNELGKAQPITKLNVANYFSVNSISRAIMKDSQGQPLSSQVFTNAVYLFVVFDKPIAVKDFRIDGNGAMLPMHEIQEKNSRSALIVFDGPIVGTVVNVEAVF